MATITVLKLAKDIKPDIYLFKKNPRNGRGVLWKTTLAAADTDSSIHKVFFPEYGTTVKGGENKKNARSCEPKTLNKATQYVITLGKQSLQVNGARLFNSLLKR